MNQTGDSSDKPWEIREKEIIEELKELRKPTIRGEIPNDPRELELSRELFLGSSDEANTRRLQDSLPDLKKRYDEGETIKVDRLLRVWGIEDGNLDKLPDLLREVVENKILKHNDWIIK